MNSFVVVVLVLATIVTLSQAGLDKKESIELLEKCKKATNATEDSEKLFETQEIPTSPEGKCMMQCALEEKKLMKGDKVDAQAVSDFLENLYKDDPEQLEKAATAVAKCALLDVKGKDKCDVAIAYMECGKGLGFRL